MNIRGISEAKVADIPVGNIAMQEGVRKSYEEEKLDELAASVRARGVLQPILVQKTGNGNFLIVLGSRRFLAAKHAGMETVPAIIEDELDDKEVLELQLTENLQREDLTPFEEAWAILRLKEEYGMSFTQIKEKIHRGVSFVRQRLQLLSLPKEIQEMVAERKLGLCHIPALAGLSTDEQRRFAHQASSESLSQQELTASVLKELGNVKGERRGNKGKKNPTKITLQIERFTGFLDRDLTRSFFSGLKEMEKSAIQNSLNDLAVKVEQVKERIRRKNDGE